MSEWFVSPHAWGVLFIVFMALEIVLLGARSLALLDEAP
jgi:hypothetical protein